MSKLRIKDAPLLPDVDGSEKVPTGGRGDYAVSIDQLKTFAQGSLPQQIEDHINDLENPHNVTKDQVGLGNVDNTSDLDKPISTATQTALNLKSNTVDVDNALNLKANTVDVDNALNLKADLDYVNDSLNLKANIEDVNVALNLKADKTYVDSQDNLKLDKSEKAIANGLATLDSSGKVPAEQLPSYVDDVLEFTSSTLPVVGETGKIYITTDTNRTWRWSGTQYVEISNGGVSDSTLKLETARNINGVAFDGTQNIEIPHNNLTNRNTSGAHTASSILDSGGDNQQVINDRAKALHTVLGADESGVLTDDGAREALDVYSKAETDSIAGTPNATETVAGKAKIATTAIAQAGTNDTDFLTAKKLRDALNASGTAPISACRAWAIYNTITNTFVGQMNVASITMTGGRLIVVLSNPMPSAVYLVLADRFAGTSGTAAQAALLKRDPTYAQTETTFQLVQYSTNDGLVSSATGTISFAVF